MRNANPKEALSYLDQAIEQVNDAIKQIRHFIEGGLLPKHPSHQDFSSSLEGAVRSFSARSSIQFHMEIDSKAARLFTEGQHRELLGIVQEALNNCLRHSSATRGWVSMKNHDRFVRLEVRDNEVGFNPEALEFKGQGLMNMRMRARKIGATFQIRSVLHCGTRVIVNIHKKAPGHDN